MSSVTPTTAGKPPQQRRGGFLSLLITEWALLRREPMILFWALIFPIGLLVVLGSSTSNKPERAFGGLRFIVVYTPVLMTFTLTRAMLFRGLPLVKAPQRLVMIQEISPDGRRGVSYPDFEEWAAQAPSFDGMAFEVS